MHTRFMRRTTIELDDSLIRKARKLTRLKTKREIVDFALELLVRTEKAQRHSALSFRPAKKGAARRLPRQRPFSQ